jgi:hypothetical protein
MTQSSRRFGGSLAKAEFYSKSGATKAHDASDRIIYDTDTGKLFYDDDGKGGHDSVLFAVLSNKPQSLTLVTLQSSER